MLRHAVWQSNLTMAQLIRLLFWFRVCTVTRSAKEAAAQLCHTLNVFMYSVVYPLPSVRTSCIAQQHGSEQM